MTAIHHNTNQNRDGNTLGGIVAALLIGIPAYWHPTINVITGRRQVTGHLPLDIAITAGIIGPVMCLAAIVIAGTLLDEVARHTTT